jgi:hypothetical protein
MKSTVDQLPPRCTLCGREICYRTGDDLWAWPKGWYHVESGLRHCYPYSSHDQAAPALDGSSFTIERGPADPSTHAMVAAATGGGPRAREVRPQFANEDPFEFATGTVRFGDGPTIPASSFSMATEPPRPAYGFEAGSLEAHGTLEMTLDEDGMGFAAVLLAGTGLPRHDLRYEYPDGADKYCPVCHEPATALNVEGVAFFPSGGVRDGDSVSFRLVGVDPAAYRCEPCGHQFDRDGKEIEP